jgi:hypothetical protein
MGHYSHWDSHILEASISLGTKIVVGWNGGLNSVGILTLGLVAGILSGDIMRNVTLIGKYSGLVHSNYEIKSHSHVLT